MGNENPELRTVDDAMKEFFTLSFRNRAEVNDLATTMQRIYLEHARNIGLNTRVQTQLPVEITVRQGATHVAIREVLASLLVTHVCRELMKPLRSIASLTDPSPDSRLKDVNTILAFVRNRLGVTVGVTIEGNQWTCRVVSSVPESEKSKSV